MQSTMSSLTLSWPRVPFLFSPLSLYARFCALTDQRDPRGIRYPLAVLLTIATLAKLAEQNEFARHCGLGAVTCPHPRRPLCAGSSDDAPSDDVEPRLRCGD